MTATTETPTHAESGAALDLLALLENGAPAKQIAAYLDALPSQERIAQVMGATGKRIEALYDAAADMPALTIDDVVGPDEKGTIIYEGRNSLPLFSRFQKRFERVEGGTIVGYNHQTMSFVTGPGYFVVKGPEGKGETANEPYFDYTATPPAFPEGWPGYKPNDRGLSKAVFMNLKDYMRPVARGVIVGRAFKKGAPEGSYFILARAL